MRDGMDDIPLAFAADAWSRTGRVSIEAAASGPVALRSGLVLLAQPAAEGTSRLPLTSNSSRCSSSTGRCPRSPSASARHDPSGS